MLPGGLDMVTSVMLNPTPANTFTDPLNLRVCDRTPVPHEACIRNSIEVQNYVLQVPYAVDTLTQHVAQAERVRGPESQEQREAALAMQAREGSSVLALSEYMIFSPT